jgi:pimeloyl-ACP methyl ester carboxylesterase
MTGRVRAPRTKRHEQPVAPLGHYLAERRDHDQRQDRRRDHPADHGAAGRRTRIGPFAGPIATTIAIHANVVITISGRRRVIGPSRTGFDSGDVEAGLRPFFDAILGSGFFDRLSMSARTALAKQQGPELRSQFATEPSAYMPPLRCESLGQLARPTLLVTGEQSPAVFLLITAELERCLDGESHVTVPGAGHPPQKENATFYNHAVMAFLRRR